MTSAAWPLQVALVDALNADAGYQAAVGGAERTFSGRAPQNTAGRYVVVGDTGERPLGAWSVDMMDGEVLLHIWTPQMNNLAPLEVWAAIERVLNGQRLVVAGHVQVRGHVELISLFQDPGGAKMHGVARYTVTTAAEA